MRIIAGVFSLVFLYFSAPSTLAQSGTVQAQEILAKASRAVRQKNYSGRLTYEHSGQLELVEIAHSVFDGVEFERISYLNGPSRAIAKSGRKATCATHGGSLLGGSLVRLANGDISSLALVYDVNFWGVERIAGRESWVLRFVPKDKNRHSFILAIDQASFLPTKALFVSGTRKVLERIHMVALDTEVSFTISDFVEGADYARVDEKADCSEGESPSTYATWRPRWLPKGFILSNYSHSEEDGHMETYTDGLASFSVFTKPVDQSENIKLAQSTTSRWVKGATVVSMRLLRAEHTDRHIHVSVLGEIPNETVDRVLSSVSLVSE